MKNDQYFDLFVVEGDSFYSPSMMRRMRPYDVKTASVLHEDCNLDVPNSLGKKKNALPNARKEEKKEKRKEEKKEAPPKLTPRQVRDVVDTDRCSTPSAQKCCVERDVTGVVMTDGCTRSKCRLRLRQKTVALKQCIKTGIESIKRQFLRYQSKPLRPHHTPPRTVPERCLAIFRQTLYGNRRLRAATFL